MTQVSQESVLMLLGAKECELMQYRTKIAELEGRLIMSEGMASEADSLREGSKTWEELYESKCSDLEVCKATPAVTDYSKLTISPQDLKSLLDHRDALTHEVDVLRSRELRVPDSSPPVEVRGLSDLTIEEKESIIGERDTLKQTLDKIRSVVGAAIWPSGENDGLRPNGEISNASLIERIQNLVRSSTDIPL